MKDLTAREVAAIRKPGKHRVSRQLYLQLTEGGARSWLFRYERHGRPHWHGLGSCDLVTLAEARDAVIDCRKLLRAGIDPIEAKKAEKVQALLAAASTMTFGECGKAYIRAHESGWRNPVHRQQWPNTLRDYVYPVVGKLPVQAVDTAMVMKILEPIWTTKPETASRVRGRIEAIIDWATVSKFRTGDNPARWKGHLDKLLPQKTKVRKVRHQPAMPYRDVPAFMGQLREQTSISARALEFTVLCAARTSESIGATWPEIDRAAKLWIIPTERIKAGKEQRVPLSDRALELLDALPREDGNPHLFVGAKAGKGLSNMAMLELLRGMAGNGYTVHGFRSSFRDWAGETTTHPREVIEHALAHQLKDESEAAYQRGDLLEKRRRLMRDWARYCASPPRPRGEVIEMAEHR
jgi:integrase